MNAKELRKVAEWLKYLAYPRVCYEEFRGIDGTETMEKFNTIAEYVLARLRDDDDEPVNEEWVSWSGAVKGEYGFWILGDVLSFGIIDHNVIIDHWDSAIKTRGQFRALCKGLGIELKEKAC